MLNKMESKIEEGMWAGITNLTNEAVMLTDNGVKRARTIWRVEDKDKYDLRLLNGVNGKPISEWKEDDEEHEEALEDPVECEKRADSEEHVEEEEEERQI